MAPRLFQAAARAFNLGPDGQRRAGPGGVADRPQHAERLLGGRVRRSELPTAQLNRGAAEDRHGKLLPPARASRQLDSRLERVQRLVDTSGEVAGPAQPGEPGTAGPSVPAAVSRLEPFLEKRGRALGVQQPPDVTRGRQAAGQHHIVTE